MITPAARHDLYVYFHKALRAYMGHVLMDIGRTDWRDAEDRSQQLEAVRELLLVCRNHIAQQNRYIHPAMEARQPGSTRLAADEHTGQLFAIDALALLADLVERVPAPERSQAGQRLYRELAVFVADCFEHMAVEESEHNEVLWAHYSDAELRAIEREMVSEAPAGQTPVLLDWMLPHLNPAERADMLGDMRQVAPNDVFERVMGRLRGQLPSKDWGKLTTALGAVTG
ncbi:hypothetical protein [Chitinimonas sp.]|uniref:hemerythrin domain-containing protein n=1 Tax=Chitinimonas sp. TaxID=1934313 RepID=UPI0035ADC1EA